MYRSDLVIIEVKGYNYCITFVEWGSKRLRINNVFHLSRINFLGCATNWREYRAILCTSTFQKILCCYFRVVYAWPEEQELFYSLNGVNLYILPCWILWNILWQPPSYGTTPSRSLVHRCSVRSRRRKENISQNERIKYAFA